MPNRHRSFISFFFLLSFSYIFFNNFEEGKYEILCRFPSTHNVCLYSLNIILYIDREDGLRFGSLYFLLQCDFFNFLLLKNNRRLHSSLQLPYTQQQLQWQQKQQKRKQSEEDDSLKRIFSLFAISFYQLSFATLTLIHSYTHA